jgi:hypothetical protein
LEFGRWTCGSRLDNVSRRCNRRRRLKWSFLFWISQLAAVAGTLSALLPRG